MKTVLASLKAHTNSKKILLVSLVDFFLFTFIAGFQNNFHYHRQVTEQLLETLAAMRKPEQAL
jgi:hypothetical protein